MIKNAYLYAKTEVLGEKFLKDTKNKYLLIGQSPFKGKIDESGEVILPEGVKVRLQIIEDQSEPVYDKHTGDVTMHWRRLKQPLSGKTILSLLEKEQWCR